MSRRHQSLRLVPSRLDDDAPVGAEPTGARTQDGTDRDKRPALKRERAETDEIFDDLDE